MQPDHPHGPPPAQPAAGWPPPGHQVPPATQTAERSAATNEERRTRPGLVALVAVLVEIIAIAAADNQWVAQKVSDRNDVLGTTGNDLAFTLLTYQWRFAPRSGDVFHVLYGQWTLIAAVLVLTALLVGLASRSTARFAPVFFGAWAAVVAATCVGAIARGAVVDSRLAGDRSRFQFILFSNYGPSQYAVVAGLVLGFVVALAAGFTAIAARRGRQTPPPAVAPMRDDAPTTQIERPPSDAGDARQQFRPPHDDATEQFRPQAEPEPTREMPRVEDEGR